MRSAVVDALRSYDVTPVVWSQRENVWEEFGGVRSSVFTESVRRAGGAGLNASEGGSATAPGSPPGELRIKEAKRVIKETTV